MQAQTPLPTAPAAPAAFLELDGQRLNRLLRAGIRQLLADQEQLNKINVFPVADGDTGTNMSLTLRAVLHQLQMRADPHAGSTLTRVADAALDAARGNSGAILAQFFLGVADSAGTRASLSTAQFAAAVRAGANYARDGVGEPREGTLLSVMRAFADEVTRLTGEQRVQEFAELFTRALPPTRQALQNTRTQLEALRVANVVDAGAQGFVDLLEGMLRQVGGDTDVPEELPDPQHATEVTTAGEPTDLSQRYCVECTLLGSMLEHRKLREQLAPLGSSLVLAGTQRKARIHIHANEPNRVFELAALHGTVSGHKVDDLRRQQDTAHAVNRRVAILTDSVADLPEAALDEFGIHIVPLRIHFGARSYLDKAGLSSVDFLDELVRNPIHPTTSQPSHGDFRRHFEFLATHFAAVISVNVSAKVSGTLGSASSAAQRVQPAERVTVIDTLNVSVGQGLLVMHAARCAARGLDRAAVVAKVREAIPRVRAFALAGSLDYAVRGGRIKPIVKSIADRLGLAPILMTLPDGRVAPRAALLRRGNLPRKFANWMRRHLDPKLSYRIGIGHAAAEPQARELLQALTEIHPRIESSFVIPIGSTLAAHAGPGTLVVGIHQCSADE